MSRNTLKRVKAITIFVCSTIMTWWMLWSAESVANDYTALFKTESRPTIVYKKAQRIAEIEILYPIFINPSSQKRRSRFISNRAI
ncbi:Uncharacterised protein [Providencia rustigianii]|nr:Uncharacterised protein [Providencia rustigianii]